MIRVGVRCSPFRRSARCEAYLFWNCGVQQPRVKYAAAASKVSSSA